MNGIMKMIFLNNEKTDDKAFFAECRNNLSANMDESVTKAFKGILSSLGNECFNDNIKNYRLLESFIFSNLAKPQYQQGDFVFIKNEFVELVPNEKLFVKVASVIVDDNKCKIYYSVSYRMNGEYQFKVVEESAIIQKQKTDFTIENYYGRDDLERFQYLQMRKRAENLMED